MKFILILALVLKSTFAFSQNVGNLDVVKDSTDVEPRTQEAMPVPRNNNLSIQTRFDNKNLLNGKYLDRYTIRTAATFFGSINFRVDWTFASSNKSGNFIFGLGDLRLRVMQSKRINSKKLYFVYGSEFRFPTASASSLGTGKWQARPQFGLTYYLGKSDGVQASIVAGVNYRFDYAGANDRNHIRIIGYVPNIDVNGKKWYLGYYGTWTYDFVRKAWDIPLDFEFGYKIFKQFTLSAEFINPTVNNKVYTNEYLIKLKYKFK